MEDRLREVKSIISSILISSPYTLTVQQIQKDYYGIQDTRLPHEEFGFRSAESFLKSLTDTITVRGNGPYAEVIVHVNEKNAHINRLVTNQRKPKTKSQSRRHLSPTRREIKRFKIVPPRFQIPPLSNAFVPLSRPSTSNLHKEFNHLDISGKRLSINRLNEQVNTLSLQNGREDVKPESPINVQPTTESLQSEVYVSDTEIDNVPIQVQNNLKEIVVNTPMGVWCKDLPKIYKERFGDLLLCGEYGYSSLVQMCKDLNHIFGYIRPSRGDYQLFAKETSVLPKKESVPIASTSAVEPQLDFQLALPNSKILQNVTETFAYPPNTAISPDLIPYQFLRPDQKEMEFIDVIVTEIYDPSKFWLLLAANYQTLNTLMDEVQAFYAENHVEYKMVPYLMETNILCSARFNGAEYHRGIIVDLMTDYESIVKVFFIDYGTVSTCKLREVCFLHEKFCELPRQAIRARLSNIKPPVEHTQWSIEASIRFLEMSSNKQLVAQLQTIEWEKHILKINLADTTSDIEYYVNDALVQEGLAIFNYQAQKARPPGGHIPVVQHLHQFPTFDELEYAVVPNLCEMTALRANHIPITTAYPHYFRTDETTTAETTTTSVDPASERTTVRARAHLPATNNNNTFIRRISTKLDNLDLNLKSGGYFDAGVEVTPATLEARNFLHQARRDPSTDASTVNKFKRVIAALPFLSNDDDDDDFTMRNPIKPATFAYESATARTMPRARIIEKDLGKGKVHVLTYKNETYLFVLQALSCCTKSIITIERIRKELLLKCACEELIALNAYEDEVLARELDRCSIISNDDSKVPGVVYVIRIGFLSRLLRILQCEKSWENFEQFLQ